MSVRLPGLLDNTLTEIERLKPSSGTATFKMTGTSEASLTFPEDETIPGIRDWVSLYTQKGFAGYFRVTNVSHTFTRRVQCALLHGIDVLSDSVWPEETTFTGTKAAFIQAILAKQTALVNGVVPWVLGTCADTSTVTDVKINYSRLSDLLSGLEEEGGDYYFTYDQTSFPWTVNFVQKPSAVSSEFRLTRNVQTATVTYNDADLCTRLILSDKETVTTYDNTDAQAEYGIVTKTVTIESGDKATYAADFLQKHSVPSVQIQISGEELSWMTGDTWDEYSVGLLCQVALPDYGHTFQERATTVSYPDFLNRPDQVTVSLANDLPTFSETIMKAIKNSASASGLASDVSDLEEKFKEFETWQVQTDETIENHAGQFIDLGEKVTLAETVIGQTASDAYIVAQATGILLDADGHPILDGDGHYQYDPNASGTTLTARINVNASEITQEVSRATDAEGTLSSRISVEADKITSVVSQTGVVTAVFDETKTYAAGDCVLYNGVAYVFTKAHTAGPWIGTGENGDVKLLGSLQTQITQTATDIVSINGQVETNTTDISTIKGSTIWQKENAIATLVGVIQYDNKTGVMTLKDVAGLYANYNNVVTGYVKDNELTAGMLIKKINDNEDKTKLTIKASMIDITADSGSGISIDENGNISIVTGDVVDKINARTGEKIVKISADQIDLDGYVTMDSFDSEGGFVEQTIYVGGIQVYENAWIDGNLTMSADSDAILGIVEATSVTANESFFIGDTQLEESDITNMVTNATVSNNVLTLTKRDGTTVNFSKATTLHDSAYVAGETTKTAGWSGGRYTVSASQTNYDTEEKVNVTTEVATISTSLYGTALNGTITQNSTLKKYIDVPLKIQYAVSGEEGDEGADTGYTETKSFDASVIYDYAVEQEGGIDSATVTATYDTLKEYIAGGTYDLGATMSGHQYAKITVTANDESTYVIGINASSVYTAGWDDAKGVKSAEIANADKTDDQKTYTGWEWDTGLVLANKFARITVTPNAGDTYYIGINASGLYTAGQNAMTASGSWGTYTAGEDQHSNTFTYQAYTTDTPPVAKGTAQTTAVALSTGLWNGYKQTVYLKEDSTILAEYEVDASSIVSGEAGIESTGDWAWDEDSEIISRTITAKNSETATIYLPVVTPSATPTYNSTTHKYDISLSASVLSHSIATGSTATGTEAYEDGQNSVNVSKGDWETASASAGTNNQIVFSPSAGTGKSQTLKLLLTASNGWDNNKKTITVYDGSTSGSKVIEYEADASTVYTNAQAAVTAGTGSISGSWGTDSTDTDTYHKYNLTATTPVYTDSGKTKKLLDATASKSLEVNVSDVLLSASWANTKSGEETLADSGAYTLGRSSGGAVSIDSSVLTGIQAGISSSGKTSITLASTIDSVTGSWDSTNHVYSLSATGTVKEGNTVRLTATGSGTLTPTEAFNAVSVSGPTWSAETIGTTNTATFTTDAPTPATDSVSLTLANAIATPTASNWKATSKLLAIGATATVTDGDNTTVLTATDSKSLSVSAADITLTKGSIALDTDSTYSGKYTVSKSSGGLVTVGGVDTVTTAVTSLDIALELTQPSATNFTFANGKYTYQTSASVKVDGTANVLTRTITGLSLTPTEAINYGKSLVGLSDASWSANTGSTLPSSRTVTVKTTGRTNASGTTDNLSKEIALYLTQSTSGNDTIVYLRTGSTSGTQYMQTTVTVTVTAASIVANSLVYDKDAETATGSIAWTLSNGRTGTLTNVSFDDVYKSGLTGGSDYKTTADFEFTNDSGWSDEYSLNVSAIYQQGVTDASASTKYRWIYSTSNNGYIRIRTSPGSGDNELGRLLCNTKVTFISYSTNPSGYTYVYYDGYYGYVLSSLVHTTPKSGVAEVTTGWDTPPEGYEPTPAEDVVIKGVYASGYSGSAKVYITYANGRSERFGVYATMAQVTALSTNQGTIVSTAASAYADTTSYMWADLVGRICYAVYSDGSVSSGMVIADPTDEG